VFEDCEEKEFGKIDAEFIGVSRNVVSSFPTAAWWLVRSSVHCWVVSVASNDS
jgi:hypothetical protein